MPVLSPLCPLSLLVSCWAILPSCSATRAPDTNENRRNDHANDSRIAADQGAGQVTVIRAFSSRHVAQRDLYIWLPERYDQLAQQGAGLPVLYMHDGQMLFDASSTWNGQSWDAHVVAQRLIDTGAVRPFMIVGIANGQQRRHAEYYPQKPFEAMDRAVQDRLYAAQRPGGDSLFSGHKVQSDAYLAFLVEEVMPWVKDRYRVLDGPANHFVMGSSMGGLISLYAISEYPDVFGGAACLSTHWPGGAGVGEPATTQAFLDYMAAHLPDPATHKLYFDHGTATLDALYPPLQQQADRVLARRGYGAGDLLSLRFQGAEHNEDAWKARLHVPLTFLFGK